MPPRPPAAPPPQPHHSHHHNPNHPRSPNEHLIQFYNAEDTLFDAISSFILPSFFSSEHAAVIVATKPHLEALDLYLRQQNLVPELLRKRDQMFLAPAEAILETLMPNGVVEEKIFFDFFGPLFARLQKKYPRLLVYGELVNILCERDEHVKAHELEEVWEAFLLGKDAALLCGYNLNVFSSDGLEDVFQKICRSHSHVTPAEDVRAGGGGVFGRPEDQPMVLAMLQQKNLRLEAEMSRRAAVELALRATLQHLGTKPTDGIRVRDHDGAMAQVTLPPTGIMAATTIDGFTEYFPNDKFLELSGLTASQARRDPGWLGAVHYSDRERVSHTIRLVDGKSRRLEYRFVLPDGSIRWVVGDSVSKETGYVHTAVEITQFRQQETPAPPLRSRTASVASGASGEPSAWLGPPPLPPPPGTAWKRTIGYSRISSPNIPPATSPVNVGPPRSPASKHGSS
jgi:PAS domain-containing protein